MTELLRWGVDLLRHLLRTLDWPLLGALLALMAIGLAVLYSAGGEALGSHLVLAQGVRFGVGLVAMWALSRITPVRLRAWTPGVFAVALVPLVLVLFIGTGKHGAHWIDLKFFYLQPSELLKIALPMMLAWYLHREPLPPGWRTTLVAALLIGLPTGLILLQPDFGTAMLVAASGVFGLYLAGLSWWWFITAGVLGGTAVGLVMFAPISWFSFLREYQQNRILTFRDPENDPLWCRMEHPAVEDRHRRRRLDRQGLGPGLAVAPGLPARTHHRLHLLGAVGGVRLGGRGRRVAAVPVRGGALPVDRDGCARHLLAPARGHTGDGAVRLRDRQRRHGVRPAARGGRADAAAQLRRHVRGVAAGGPGPGDGGARASACAWVLMPHRHVLCSPCAESRVLPSRR